jgi:hypothetical protein
MRGWNEGGTLLHEEAMTEISLWRGGMKQFFLVRHEIVAGKEDLWFIGGNPSGKPDIREP